jgi:hypothetical protein
MGLTNDVHVPNSLRKQQAALDAVLASSTFARNRRLAKLLQYLCSRSFAGESGSLKEYTIATDVFGRPPDFDQSTDAIVRVEMHRLRKKLKDFYATDGAHQPIEIVIHSGHYSPEFVERSPEDRARKEHQAEKPRVLAPPLPVPSKSTRHWLTRPAAAILVLFSVVAAILWFIRSKPATSIPQVSATVRAEPVLAVAPAGAAIRILSGRLQSKVRDREGQEWGPDAYFQGGTAVDVPAQPIYRTRDAVLFQGMRTGEFSYKIPLKPGPYELHLYFVDTAFTPGISLEGGENTRFFDVELNGRPLLRNLDIIASAGPNTAFERVFKDVQPDKDGFLHLGFHKVVRTPLLNALEILPAVPHRMRPVRIFTQDSGFTDKFGANWAPDNYFLNGRQIAKFGIIAGPDDSQIYERERYGNFSYAIPAAPGTYRLNLHFAETYFGPEQEGGGGVGDRVFDVYCNGIVLLNEFDVFREAGYGHQLIKTFHGIKPNAQGNVLISFVPRVNYAMVSALELIDESSQ